MLCAAAIPHTYDEDNVETEDLEPAGQLAGNTVVKQQRLHAKQSGRLLEKKDDNFFSGLTVGKRSVSLSVTHVCVSNPN